MKNSVNILTIVLIAFLMGSCDENPFLSNLFSSIDEYELPSSFSSIDDILDESGDDGFLDALSEDDELTEDVIALLDDILDDDPADADQGVALLLADVYLATSGADEILNNVNDLLVDVLDGSDSLDFDSPEDLISDFFVLDDSLTPAEQEELVALQLEAFLGAAEALEFYGETMIAGQDASSEINSGETSATAIFSGIVAYMIENAVEDNEADPVVPLSDEDAITAIAAAIVDPLNNDFPDTEINSDVDEAETTEEMVEAMLGPGLTEVVDDGFDLSAFTDMEA